jgi:hypothetical protein
LFPTLPENRAFKISKSDNFYTCASWDFLQISLKLTWLTSAQDSVFHNVSAYGTGQKDELLVSKLFFWLTWLTSAQDSVFHNVSAYGTGQKDELLVSKLFFWYGGDFGADERAVVGWIAANMPSDTKVSS